MHRQPCAERVGRAAAGAKEAWLTPEGIGRGPLADHRACGKAKSHVRWCAPWACPPQPAARACAAEAAGAPGRSKIKRQWVLNCNCDPAAPEAHEEWNPPPPPPPDVRHAGAPPACPV